MPSRVRAANVVGSISVAREQLTRDHLGTRKVLVLSSEVGRVVGVASWSGAVLWARTVSGATRLRFVQVRHATTHDPVGAIVGEDARTGHVVLTVIDPITGAVLADALPTRHTLPWRPTWVHAVTPATVQDGFGLLLADDVGHAALVPVHVPGPFTAHAAPPVLATPLYFFHVAAQPSAHAGGVCVSQAADGSVTAVPTWSLPLDADEVLEAQAFHSPYERVTSIGRVLGNRSVLYKYLNPHLLAIATTQRGLRTGVELRTGWRAGG